MLSIKKVFAHSIKQIFLICFLVLGVLTFIATGQTPNITDIRPLPVNKTVEREIKAAEEHFYTVELKEGKVLRLELEEGQDVNYVFRLIRANDGQTIIESDLTTLFGRESITYVAPAKESLKVLVKAPKKINGSAKYKLTATKAKRATELDKERIKAEKLSKEVSKLSEDALKLSKGNRTESYQKATTLAEEALNIRRKQGDRYWEGWTLNFLGNLYKSLGDNKKAVSYYNQTLQIIKLNDNKIAETRILLESAGIYSALNETTQAIDSYNQALKSLRELKDRTKESNALYSLGLIYALSQQYEKAKDYYEQSLAIKRELKDRSGESFMLLTLAQVYSRFGQLEKQKDYLKRALVINRETKERRNEAFVLYKLADFYNESRNLEEQRACYEQILAIQRELKDKDGEGKVLTHLGTFHNEYGQYEKAVDYYKQALAIWREIQKGKDLSLKGSWKFNRQVQEASMLLELMFLLEKLKQKQLSIIYGKQAINVLQEQRRNFLNSERYKELDESFRSSQEPNYRFLANLLIEEGRFAEAQAVLDLLKVDEYKQIVRGNGEPLYTLPYSRAEEEAITIVDRLAALGRELSELKAKPKDALTAEETTRLNYL